MESRGTTVRNNCSLCSVHSTCNQPIFKIGFGVTLFVYFALTIMNLSATQQPLMRFVVYS